MKLLFINGRVITRHLWRIVGRMGQLFVVVLLSAAGGGVRIDERKSWNG